MFMQKLAFSYQRHMTNIIPNDDKCHLKKAAAIVY